RLFALIGTVAAAVARPLECEVGLSQQWIVFGKSEHIITNVVDGRIESRRVVRAAGILAAHVVNHAVVAIHERAIQRLGTAMLAIRPPVQRRLSHPETIRAKVPPLRGTAPASG